MHPTQRVSCVLALAITAPLTAQDMLRIWHGQTGDGFGASLAAVGDVNLDGAIDFVVGAPDRLGGIGAVDVFTCLSGALLRTIQGNAVGDRFGQVVAAAGDLDRDGHPDMWVLAATTLDAYSGRDGSLLWRYARPEHFAPMADFDFDGHSDLALVNREGDIVVRSGNDGGVVARMPATGMPIVRFAVCGDVDGDGTPDVMTTRLGDGDGRNVVNVWNVATGQSLFEQTTVLVAPGFGVQIGSAGDVDRDGRADFFIHDSQPIEPPDVTANGITYVYSGATRTELLRDVGLLWGDRGRFVSIARQKGYSALPADVDGDAIDERFARYDLWGAAQVQVRRDGATTITLPGSAIQSVGDADRDGMGDYLIVKDEEVWLVTAAGMTRQHHGVAQPGDRVFGCTVIADVDQDGYGDYFVGFAFPGDLVRQPYSAVTIYSGSTGRMLWGFTRNPTMGMPNLVLAAGGDIDRNGWLDVGVSGYGDREIRLFGGVQASAPFLVITDTDATAALALGADWTADDVSDVFAASTTAIELRSGVDGALVATIPVGARDLRLIGDVDGDTIQDLLAGTSVIGSASRDVVVELPSLPVVFVGDENADGRADAWLVDGDHLVLHSVVDGIELRRLPTAAGSVAIAALATGSDWNRDGFIDFLVGQPTWEGFGRAAVVSGLDGRLLHTEWGQAAGDQFGVQVGLLAFDPARHTLAGMVASANHGDITNFGYGRWAKVRDYPAAVHEHGIACSHSGMRPQIQWNGGAPCLGAAVSVQTVGLTNGTATIFLFGTREDAFGGLALPANLRSVGMPGCVLHVAPELQMPAIANAGGEAAVSLRIPDLPAILGMRVHAQSLATAPSANQLGLLASDGSRIIIGR